MASPGFTTTQDWERLGAFPARDDEDDDRPRAACEACEGLRADLARARGILAAIARVDPKPAKPEIGDDPADCLVIGYAQALAGIRTRIELFLKSRRS